MKPHEVPADAPMCASGKRPFRTEGEARAALSNAQHGRSEGVQGRRPGAVESAYYECAVCHWWHLTATDRRQTRGSLANRKGRRR